MCLNRTTNRNRRALFLFLTLFLFAKIVALELRNGDLIFQESRLEEGVGSAIKNVTQSAADYQFTHVGIVYIPDEGEDIFVIEATTPLVRIVPLSEYLYSNEVGGNNPRSVVGRLKEAYQSYVPDALQEALQLLGKEYDYGFVLNNDKYYCSELIYEIFLKANGGRAVFPLNLMTFKKHGTDETDEKWISYFGERDLEIPEGEWGINPGAMSTSEIVELLGEIKELF